MVSGTARGEEDAGRNGQRSSSSPGWQNKGRTKERMAVKYQRPHHSGENDADLQVRTSGIQPDN